MSPTRRLSTQHDPQPPDEKKLGELIVYIARKAEEDCRERFGETIMNKILFYIDFQAYGQLGHSITGYEYQKNPNGPTLIQFLPIIRKLIASRSIAIQEVMINGKLEKRPVALREADLKVFKAEEIDIASKIIHKTKSHTATSLSELSHKLPAWKMVPTLEVIPKELIHFVRRELTEPELLLAHQLQKEFKGKEVACA